MEAKALLIIMQLCLGAVCRIESIHPPCLVSVERYKEVKVTSFKSPTGRLMMPGVKIAINICEIEEQE